MPSDGASHPVDAEFQSRDGVRALGPGPWAMGHGRAMSGLYVIRSGMRTERLGRARKGEKCRAREAGEERERDGEREREREREREIESDRDR